MYIEDGVPQRIHISDRTHSIPLRLPNMCLTQPLPALSRVLESHNCHLIASYYRHFRLVVLESFSNFLTHLSHAGKKPVLTCHLAILKNTT